jgi:hypothetical protein
MDELLPGALLDAASLNTRMAQVRNKHNAIPPQSVRGRSLGAQHCPQQIVESQFREFEHTVQLYTGLYPGYNLTGPGWATVNSDGGLGTGTDLEVTLNTPVVFADPGVIGVMLLAYFEVRMGHETLVVVPSVNVHFCLQGREAAVWKQITETETWVRMSPFADKYAAYRPHALRFLLRTGNIGGLLSVNKIRARVSASCHYVGHNPLEYQLDSVALGSLVIRGENF